MEALIKEVQVVLFDNTKILISANQIEYFQPIDMQYYGRCYTFKPSSDMIKKGIFKLKWQLRAEGTKIMAFVNSNGILRVQKEAETQYIVVLNYETLTYHIEHDLYEMLDFEGEPCNNDQVPSPHINKSDFLGGERTSNL